MTDNQNKPPEPPPAPLHDPNHQNETNPPLSQPNMPSNLQPNMQDVRDLKRAQTLIMVANISAPVSLFIGGMLLSVVGLVCGIVSYRKLKRLSTKSAAIGVAAERIKRFSIIGIAACGLACGLNAISFYIMFPIMLNMLEQGTYPGMSGFETGPSTGSSTWG